MLSAEEQMPDPPPANFGPIAAEFQGPCPFDRARKRQEELIRLRISGEIPDTIFYCEHPPVLTLGNRLSGIEDSAVPALIGSLISLEQWQAAGVDVVRTSRGGEATYHGPGQLMIYPVISLIGRQIGVRRFVELLTAGVCDGLSEFGMRAEFDSSCPGIWCMNSGHRLKIGSIGLRINSGVSNHGMAVNVDCSLEPFLKFSPCGSNGAVIGSIRSILGSAPPIEQLARELHHRILRRFQKS